MNPYEVLGVSINATDNEIKLAYKEKAKQFHPDAGGDRDKMAEINRAYEILSNKNKRSIFDLTGEVYNQRSFEEKFSLLISELVGRISNNPMSHYKSGKNIMRFYSKLIEGDIKSLSDDKLIAHNKMYYLKEISKRIKSKTSVNHFDESIQSEINKLKVQVIKINIDINFLEESIGRLKSDYEYSTEQVSDDLEKALCQPKYS